jgi:hypothetical protein
MIAGIRKKEEIVPFSQLRAELAREKREHGAKKNELAPRSL